MSVSAPSQQYAFATGSGQQIDVSVFGPLDYLHAQYAMAQIASNPDRSLAHQIWLLEHDRVYTQGTACQQNTLFPSEIPVVKSDRGGQITYHGPGQIIMYPILHLKHFNLGVKSLVQALEQAAIDVLSELNIQAARRKDAPGVYVDGAKIASLGLRVRRGTCYHGLSLNVDMDLAPFDNIDPCGFQGLKVTQIANLTDAFDKSLIARQLVTKFVSLL